MKIAHSLLALIATIGLAHAGGFGGPPPFTNGSPLVSGVDGTYQASMRGDNLTGIITFVYADGVQTGGVWVTFFEGETFVGADDVIINDGDITGVLESTFSTPTSRTNSESSFDTSGGTFSSSSSSTTVTTLSGPSGYFTAELDNNSPTGSFRGDGQLAVVIRTVTSSDKTTPDDTKSESSTTTEVMKTDFKVKGVRAAI